jgi:hypothetical protein
LATGPVTLLYIATLLIGLGLLGYQSMKSKRAGKRQGTDVRRPPPPRRPTAGT